MSQMKCEICGCSSFTKQDAFVVCDSCGTRYSIEEVKRLMGNVKAEKTVQAAPQNGPKAQLINNAFQLLRLGNYPESFRAFKTVTEEYPEDFRGWGNLLWLLVCKGYCCKRGMDKMETCDSKDLAESFEELYSYYSQTAQASGDEVKPKSHFAHVFLVSFLFGEIPNRIRDLRDYLQIMRYDSQGKDSQRRFSIDDPDSWDYDMVMKRNEQCCRIFNERLYKKHRIKEFGFEYGKTVDVPYEDCGRFDQTTVLPYTYTFCVGRICQYQ